MNRRDIQILRIHVGGPAITLVMPCDKEKIQKKFNELIHQATADDAIIASIFGHFEVLYDHLVCPLEKTMVALFVNKYAAYLYRLPFEMPEIAVCAKTFKLDPIVAQLNRLQRYWVFDCSAEKMKLLEGIGDFLMEIDKAHAQIDESGILFDRKGHITSLGDYFEQDHIPICLVGEPQEMYSVSMDAPFREQIVAQAATLYDIPSLMNKYFKKRIYELLENIKQMKPELQFITDLPEIIEAARQGQIKTLLFEKSYQLDACEEQVTRQILTEQACPLGYQKISLIDQIIESVCSKGGELLVAPDGSLSEYHKMVAILR